MDQYEKLHKNYLIKNHNEKVDEMYKSLDELIYTFSNYVRANSNYEEGVIGDINHLFWDKEFKDSYDELVSERDKEYDNMTIGLRRIRDKILELKLGKDSFTE